MIACNPQAQTLNLGSPGVNVLVIRRKRPTSLTKNGIVVERITKEQDYLLSHCPDLRRVDARRINDLPFI